MLTLFFAKSKEKEKNHMLYKQLERKGFKYDNKEST